MVVDDHEVVRQGVAAMLRQSQGVVVVGEATSPREAVAVAEATQPDVVVMDVRLGKDSGIEATREIRARRPATQVIMLTSFDDDAALFSSIMAGAAGYLLKQVRGTDLAAAVRSVARGQSLLDPAVTSSVLERIRKGGGVLKDERLARLSPQEERVLELVAKGKTNKEIGDELFVSEKTVKNHISHIFTKLEVNRRAEAASYFTRRSPDC
ncbi:MAG: response regulator transcription factor [Actinomycetota bacterium]|nr:response regulator transcription factor [Actinomycetota bacterium]